MPLSSRRNPPLGGRVSLYLTRCSAQRGGSREISSEDEAYNENRFDRIFSPQFG